MTIEEAIDEIKAANDEEVRYGDQSRHADAVEKRLDAFYLAFEALKLQIPKKPIPRYDDIGGQIVLMSYECPNIKCRNIMVGNGEYQFQHCEDCGQALDWSKENE